MKRRLVEDDSVQTILEEIGCHNVRPHKGEYRAALPDGDNDSSIRVDRETLFTSVYTRGDFPKDKADIFTLVQYIENIPFAKAMYRICEICGYEYYADYNGNKEVDPCIAFLDFVEPKTTSHEEVPLRKLDDSILSYYEQEPNIWFLEEGISYQTQQLFELGYSIRDSCITIPIRDELGSLVGVKGRTTLDYKKLGIPKYWFPVPTPKSLILYGLDKTYEHIMAAGKVYVFEAEKSVQKAYSFGVKNSVSIGGHEISSTQVMKLERLGVEVVLALDKNVTNKEIKEEAKKFVLPGRVYAIYENKIQDKKLKEKDAPIDVGVNYFHELCSVDMYKVS